MEKYSAYFLPTELATAKELIEFRSDPERFSYEYLIIYEIVDNKTDIHKEIMNKSMDYLIRRHENLKAYYEKNDQGLILRKYVNSYHVSNLQYDELQFNVSSKDFEKYVESKRTLKNIHHIPNQMFCFAKLLDAYILISYSHHAFKDVYSDNVIVNELFSIYHALVKDRTLSYEKVTEKFPKLPSYSEILEEFHINNKEKLNDLVYYLGPKLAKVNIPETSLLNKNTNLCKAGKMRIDFNNKNAENYMVSNGIKINSYFLTLVQIALHKIFKIQGSIPIWKLNGSRTKLAQSFLCSYIKDQVFIEELEENNTVLQQYKKNYLNIKENLEKFNDCDYSDAIQVINEKLNNNCIPKVCFNFYIYNMLDSPHIFSNKLYSDFYDVVNSNMNIYFDFNLNKLTGLYSLTIFYKKFIFAEEIINEIICFIAYGYSNVDSFVNKKLDQIILNSKFELENKPKF